MLRQQVLSKELTIIERTKGEMIPRIEMPQFLQQFEWYLDIKGFTSSKVPSKTAIEFLHASGPDLQCKIYADSGEVVVSFETTTNDEYLELLESMLSSR